MHRAWRRFTGLGFDQEVPHHSTFSKNRHGRFLESNLFQQLFEEIVARCMESGLVRGDHLSVDAASSRPTRPRKVGCRATREVAHPLHGEAISGGTAEQNPVEEPVHQQEQILTTDPDSTYATKGAC